ncbi:hypothetical protein protein [Bacillus cereus G9241]|nr:hypothetical protein protein [Bacillus cereus G9241]
MLDSFASSSTSACENVRIMIPSIYCDNTFAVSETVSPLPICISFPLKNIPCPPSCTIPASKDTRVRVECLSKIRPNIFPCNKGSCLLFFKYIANSIKEIISSCVSSSNVKRSFVFNFGTCTVDMKLPPYIIDTFFVQTTFFIIYTACSNSSFVTMSGGNSLITLGPACNTRSPSFSSCSIKLATSCVHSIPTISPLPRIF